MHFQLLTSYPIDSTDGREVALVWDTAGVEDRLYAQGELNYLLEGNLLDGTNLTKPINNSIATYNPMPSEAERMHCVLFVLAQGEVSNEEKTDRLKALYTAVKDRNIPSLLVITKIETADKPLLNSSGTITEKPASGGKSAKSAAVERQKDMGNLFRSAKVAKLIETAEKRTGFARPDIFPIANFTEADQHTLGVAKTAHILRLLERSVKYAQEARLRARRRQTPRQQSAASATPTPVSRGLPPAPSEAPSSFIMASVSSQPTAGGTQAASLTQAAQRVCADLGDEVRAPPDNSIAQCIRELGEAVNYTPTDGASLKQQLAAIIQLAGTSVPGW